MLTVWHGDETDLKRLVEAVNHNCACNRDDPTAPTCSPHRMLLDQATLDHIAFVGANVNWYRYAEDHLDNGGC